MKKLLLLALVAFNCHQAIGQHSAVRIEKSGTGTPIIFLPGFITPGTVWTETVENLKGNYESHLVSYAGFNGIEPIAMPWYEQIRQELIDYVHTNQLKKLIIVGHSMGGNLALDLAAALGEGVHRLVIVDALSCMREIMMPGVPAEAIQYENPYNQQTLAMADENFEKMATMMSEGMTSVTEKQALIKQWILEADRETYVYGYTDLLKLDLRPKLSSIKAPVLILGAPFPSKEIVVPNFEKQYLNLNNKTLEIAPEGRHFIMFDQPAWLYEKLNDFLGK